MIESEQFSAIIINQAKRETPARFRSEGKAGVTSGWHTLNRVCLARLVEQETVGSLPLPRGHIRNVTMREWGMWQIVAWSADT